MKTLWWHKSLVLLGLGCWFGLGGINLGYASEASRDGAVYSTGVLPASSASDFAVQASYIAGSAQACGIDVSIFLQRVDEALNRLSIPSTGSVDKVLAIARMQQTMQDAERLQLYNQQISCAQIAQDFNSLPLMQPNYQQTVLPQLKPGLGKTQPIITNVSPILQHNTYSQYPEGVNSSIGPLPNINDVAAQIPSPVRAPPLRSTVWPNINDKAPSIGGFVDTTKQYPNVNDLPMTGQPGTSN